MNERIKEFAGQAGFVLWKNESWNSGDVVDWSASYDDELEKFAELIVKECADLFEVEWGEEKLTGNDVGYVVKKHFGVEQ